MVTRVPAALRAIARRGPFEEWRVLPTAGSLVELRATVARLPRMSGARLSLGDIAEAELWIDGVFLGTVRVRLGTIPVRLLQ